MLNLLIILANGRWDLIRRLQGELSFNCIHLIKAVLDCKIIYTILIIENRTGMPHLKNIAQK
jgi:hypothetical protein